MDRKKLRMSASYNTSSTIMRPIITVMPSAFRPHPCVMAVRLCIVTSVGAAILMLVHVLRLVHAYGIPPGARLMMSYGHVLASRNAQQITTIADSSNDPAHNIAPTILDHFDRTVNNALGRYANILGIVRENIEARMAATRAHGAVGSATIRMPTQLGLFNFWQRVCGHDAPIQVEWFQPEFMNTLTTWYEHFVHAIATLSNARACDERVA